MSVFYGELAHLWPLVSPVGEYASEAAELLRVLRAIAPSARTLLELGSGGGHVAHHLRHAYDCHLTDLSAEMLELSRRLNPSCAHTVGDMRTLDLGTTFDLVLAHDAIDYMTTEDDLRAAFETAYRHLVPGGLACFVPDATCETYEPGADVSGGDDADGRGVRLLEWSEPADAGSTTVTVHYGFLVRGADGAVSTHYERHTAGLFPQATWERLLEVCGFEVDVVVERTDEDRAGRTIFLARKPGDGSASDRATASHDREPTVLVTGFEPFGGGTTNPSATIARALDGARIEGRRVVGRVLPVSFTAAVPALLGHLADHDPELVVALGQAGGRASISVERVAINVADASTADNDAARPVDVPVVPGGPVGYFSTLPIKPIVHALRAEGLPADVSQSAGTFVCNHVFYALMHALADRPNVRGGFLHVPYSPEQTVGLPQPTPSLAIDDQVRAVRLALATALRTTDDPPRSGGSRQEAST